MKTQTIIAEFTEFDNKSAWVQGKVMDYKFEAKLFDEGSQFGIKNGRVSKLCIYSPSAMKTTTPNKVNDLFAIFANMFAGVIINYDRGWDIRPTNENKPIFNAVMKLLETSPKRFENE